MGVERYSVRVGQISAIQLLTTNGGFEDNADEIANWCKGKAIRSYNAETGTRRVHVYFTAFDQMGRNLIETEWLIRTADGAFTLMDDKTFRENYDTDGFEPVPTCQHCLSDPRFTPMGDPDDKRCPVCGVRYSGPRRSKEFSVLVAAGLVAYDED